MNKFIQKSYTLTENELPNLPKDFTPLLKQMKKKDWLGKYKYEDGIDLILHKFGHKIPFQNNLHESFVAYKENEKKIKPLFKAFLKEIDKSVTKEFKLK